MMPACIFLGIILSILLLFGKGNADAGFAYGKVCIYFIVASTITFLGMWICYYRYHAGIHVLYLMAVIGLGSVLLFAQPIYSAPDEMTHFSNAYSTSDYMMFQDVGEGYATRRMSEWHPVYYELEITKDNMEAFARAFQAEEDHSLLTWVDSYKTNDSGFLYVIGGLGITLGRLLDLNMTAMAVLGQLLNLIFFGLAVSYAIYRIPYGKRIVACVGLLPMVVQQAASFSYDVEIIAASIVLLSLSLFFVDNKPRLIDIVSYLLAAFVLLIAKGHIYIFLIVFSLCLFCKKEWFAKKYRRYWILAVVLCLIFIGLRWDVILEAIKTTPHIRRLDADGYSPYYYLTHLGYTIGLVMRTLLTYGRSYVFQMVGGVFGWYDIFLHTPIIYLIFLWLVVTSAKKEEEPNMDIHKRVIGVLCCFCSAGLALAAMMIYETGQAATVIAGFQGRYLLPVLLVFISCVGMWRKPLLKKDWKEEHFTLVSAGLLYIALLDYLYLIP